VKLVTTFEPHIKLEIDLIPKKLLASKGYVGMTLLHGIVISRYMFRNDHVKGSNP